MNTNDDIDDVGQAVRENRPLKSAQAYRIYLARDGVEFQPIAVTDPIPTGRQILSAAGLDDRADFTLCAIRVSGDFEEVSLNETFDLRGKGAERFIAFRTDRNFKLTLNDRQLIWGQPTIPGAVLYALSGIGEDQAVFLDVRGGSDRLIEPNDLVALDGSGVERFITAPNPVQGYTIVVNAREESVSDKRVTFEQVVQLAFPGAPIEPNVRYSMTYRHAASKPHAGELAEGGSVEVNYKGTIFNVTKTVQS
ncbi:multiubiquitin domain-containing protein [Chitinibacter fontanus]|uniref:Multiubiquitin domain-containing protein n=1 Tax=Chitinibacter fontanus TaxID=1737446 RepID=A0A7D5ZCU9_9NEIS|nr:multiubiquitin domain-containing protein [Chitinibacter fontanus]QLI80864.1 multiubiquitin domain-containing protein [Chitinibacter fontanus]